MTLGCAVRSGLHAQVIEMFEGMDGELTVG